VVTVDCRQGPAAVYAPVIQPLAGTGGAPALDGQGNVYVVEFGGNRVDKISPDGRLLAVWK